MPKEYKPYSSVADAPQSNDGAENEDDAADPQAEPMPMDPLTKAMAEAMEAQAEAMEALAALAEARADAMEAQAGADDEDDEEDRGHPRCTNAEDCVGNPSCDVVRHYIQDDRGSYDRGDLYCVPCWRNMREYYGFSDDTIAVPEPETN